MDFKQQLKKYSHIKPKKFHLTKENLMAPLKKKQLPTNITIQYNQTIFVQNSNEKKEDLSKFFTAAFFNDSNPPSLRDSNNYNHHTPNQTPVANKNPFVNKNNRMKKSSSMCQIIKEKVQCNELMLNPNSRNQADFTVDPQPELINPSIQFESNTRNRCNFSMTIKSKSNSKSRLSTHNNMILFILCINCGNNIHMNDIERHSRKCTKVSDEIIKNETGRSKISSTNHALTKLKEHLVNISNNKTKLPKEFEQEMKYISTIILHYIEEALGLEEISLLTIQNLKCILKNLDALELTNYLLSSLILIDRTKVLINEKVKLLRESLKVKGNIRLSAMENKIKLKLKKIEEIKHKTELEKIKVKNLRKSSLPNFKVLNVKEFQDSNLEFIYKNNKDQDIIIQDDFLDDCINDKNDNANLNKIEDIASDIENNCSHQVVNDVSFTSMKSDITFDDCNSVNNQSNISSHSSNKNNLTIERELVIFDKGKEMKERKAFLKELLKVKFEKLHSTHKGLRIPQQLVWDECKRKKIPKEKWKEFILSELNDVEKYEEISKVKNRESKYKKELMTIVEEEKL